MPFATEQERSVWKKSPRIPGVAERSEHSFKNQKLHFVAALVTLDTSRPDRRSRAKSNADAAARGTLSARPHAHQVSRQFAVTRKNKRPSSKGPVNRTEFVSEVPGVAGSQLTKSLVSSIE